MNAARDQGSGGPPTASATTEEDTARSGLKDLCLQV